MAMRGTTIHISRWAANLALYSTVDRRCTTFYATMRMEEWRQKLMKEQYLWGANPPGTVTSESSPMIHGVSCKDWTIDSLTKVKNFRRVSRISATNPDLLSFISQYEHSGLPFVIEDCHKLPKWSADLSLERFTALVKQGLLLTTYSSQAHHLQRLNFSQKLCKWKRPYFAARPIHRQIKKNRNQCCAWRCVFHVPACPSF